jgi:hypothetical protein
VLDEVGAPGHLRCYGAVLLGGAAATQRRSGSLDRPGPTRAARVHLGRYEAARPSR